MRLRVTQLFVLCLILAVLGGCHRVRYNAVLDPLVSSGILDEQEEAIKLRFTEIDSTAPVADMELKILSRHKPRSLFTDEQGYLELPVDPVYREENPYLKHMAGRKVTLQFGTTMSFNPKSDGSSEFEHIDLTDKEVRGIDRVKVIFDKPNEAFAHRAFEKMKRHFRAVTEVTSMPPMPWGVVVVPEKKKGMAYVVNQRPDLPYTWSYDLDEIDSGKFDWTNTHEWTESTIGRHLPLHKLDREGRNRIFVDGLADYAAFRVAPIRPSYARLLEKMIEEGVVTVDLTQRFRSMRLKGDDLEENWLQRLMDEQAFPAGYPLSFVFWHDLITAHGEDLPKRFLLELRDREDRDFDACIAVLESLTGETGLADRLRRADVQHAIDVIEKIKSTQPPSLLAR